MRRCIETMQMLADSWVSEVIMRSIEEASPNIMEMMDLSDHLHRKLSKSKNWRHRRMMIFKRGFYA